MMRVSSHTRGSGRGVDRDDAVRTRFRGALLGAMIGDAVGAPFEGVASPVPAGSLDDTMPAIPLETLNISDSASVARSKLESYLADRDSLRTTDDTQMVLALAESLSEHGAVEQDALAHHLAERFDPERGYGRAVQQVLKQISDGEAWQTAARSVFEEGSHGNGAAMRVAPVGIYYHDRPDLLTAAAALQAVVTHAHIHAVSGAVLQAHAIGIAMFAGLHGQPLRPEYFLRALAGRVMGVGYGHVLLGPLNTAAQSVMSGRIDQVRNEVGNTVTALQSVPAAIAVFLMASGEVEEALGLAVELGGDTDTIASMAGAIAGAYWGEDELPTRVYALLEGEAEGTERVRAVADRLCDRWIEAEADETP